MSDTQGNKKIKQYLEDLRKNSVFNQEIDELEKEPSKAKRDVMLIELCEEYGIDWELFQNMRKDNNHSTSNWAKSVDMCEVGFGFDALFTDKPLKSALEIELHKRAYPASIDIHRFATKRDVLDYVRKNWGLIEKQLLFFSGKPKRIRTRKNTEIREFVWKNRELNNKKLKELLDEKFPKNGLVYNELYDIIRDEKKRRNRKLS